MPREGREGALMTKTGGGSLFLYWPCRRSKSVAVGTEQQRELERTVRISVARFLSLSCNSAWISRFSELAAFSAICRAVVLPVRTNFRKGERPKVRKVRIEERKSCLSHRTTDSPRSGIDHSQRITALRSKDARISVVVVVVERSERRTHVREELAMQRLECAATERRQTELLTLLCEHGGRDAELAEVRAVEAAREAGLVRPRTRDYQA